MRKILIDILLVTGMLWLLLPCVSQQTVLLPDTNEVDVRLFDDSALDRYRSDRTFEYGINIKSRSWLELRWQEFKKALRKFLFGNNRTTGDFLVLLLVVVAGIFLIKFFTHARIKGLFARRSKPSSARLQVFEEDVEIDSLEQKIADSLATADYRMAFRWSYIGMLGILNERSLIKTSLSKTNRDYRHEMSETAQSRSFDTLALAFDYIWYGDRRINRERYDKYIHLISAVWENTDPDV